jgi:DnaJ-class molecular chaperone
MSSDYYNILGISKGASTDEIKSAYKKLALKNHPDRGGNKDTFQKIQQAYEVLSDDKRRSEYDNPVSDNFFSNDPFFNQFHHQFNTGRNKSQPVKKNDYHYTCNITLEDVFNGCVKK